MKSKNKILFLSSEVTPFAKVGGLADVAGSLPVALLALGFDVKIITARYQSIKLEQLKAKLIGKISVKFGIKNYPVKIYQAFLPNTKVVCYLLDQPEWLSRGDIYGRPAGSSDFHFSTKRFLFLSQAGLAAAGFLNFVPQILHLHDWPTATAALLKPAAGPQFDQTKTLITLHNIYHQGYADQKLLNLVGLNIQKFSPLSHSRTNPRYSDVFAESLLVADGLNTVSPTYAKEILTPPASAGLHKIFKTRKKIISGITNGLDVKYFNPETDPYLAFTYNIKHLNHKIGNKLALQHNLGWTQNKSTFLASMVTRLSLQKGLELLIEGAEKMLNQGNVQMVVLGDGSVDYARALTSLQDRYPEQFRFVPGYDPHLARKIYAGADLFLMPSQFEPCGLAQMIAMRYGTLPLVHDTGGLHDTVKDYRKPGGTGFVFKEFKTKSFLQAWEHARKAYQFPNIWKKLQQNAMKKDFSWTNSAKKYAELYKQLLVK